MFTQKNYIAINNNLFIIRVYFVITSYHNFFICGRLIFGPDDWSLIVIVFLIIIPIAIFCVFFVGKILHNFFGGQHWLCNSFGANFLYYLCVGAFLSYLYQGSKYCFKCFTSTKSWRYFLFCKFTYLMDRRTHTMIKITTRKGCYCEWSYV